MKTPTANIDFGDAFRSTDDVWDACRRALNTWHGLHIVEDEDLATEWMTLIDGFVGATPPSIQELVRFGAMLTKTDPDHEAVGLTPQILPLPTQDAVSLFQDTEDPAILYGFNPNDRRDLGPRIWGFDFDRIPVDLDEDDPEDDLGTPEDWIIGANPGEFGLLMVVNGLQVDGMLAVLAEHGDKERFDDAMTAALGPPARFVGVDVWGAPGLLMTQRWCHPFDWRVDIAALSRDSCDALDSDILEILQMTPAWFDHHDWPT